jgi:hypothetical protein
MKDERYKWNVQCMLVVSADHVTITIELIADPERLAGQLPNGAGVLREFVTIHNAAFPEQLK